MKTGLYLGNVPIGKVAVTQVVSTTDEINLQDKTVIPDKISQKITADYNKGYAGLGEVTIDPIPAEFIKTNVANPAGSDNIEKDRQAYVNGSLVNGNLNVLKSITLQSPPSISNNIFSLSATNATKAILNEGATITYSENAEELLGNAEPKHVKQGVFFTSSKGLRIEGEYIEPAAPDTILQELKNIIPTTEDQIFTPEVGVTGFDKVEVKAIPSNYIDIIKNPEYVNTTVKTNEAAGVSNIEQGKKAYVNSKLVEGSLSTAPNINIENGSITGTTGSTSLQITGKPTSKAIHNDKTNIQITASIDSSFGTATEDQVLEGCTFTSAEGFSIEGKLKNNNNNNNNNNNMPSGIKAIALGTYPVGDKDISSSITINTGLNETPTFFIFKIDEKLDIRNNFGYLYQYERIAIPYINKDGTEVPGGSTVQFSGSSSSTSKNIAALNLIPSGILSADIPIDITTSRKLKANTSYSWIAIVME